MSVPAVTTPVAPVTGDPSLRSIIWTYVQGFVDVAELVNVGIVSAMDPWHLQVKFPLEADEIVTIAFRKSPT